MCALPSFYQQAYQHRLISISTKACTNRSKKRGTQEAHETQKTQEREDIFLTVSFATWLNSIRGKQEPTEGEPAKTSTGWGRLALFFQGNPISSSDPPWISASSRVPRWNQDAKNGYWKSKSKPQRERNDHQEIDSIVLRRYGGDRVERARRRSEGGEQEGGPSAWDGGGGLRLERGHFVPLHPFLSPSLGKWPARHLSIYLMGRINGPTVSNIQDARPAISQENKSFTIN